MSLTRRTFGKLALSALPASTLLALPNSKFGGVQIGINAPYSFRGLNSGADDVIKYMSELGISATELRSQPVEQAAGAPTSFNMFGPRPTPEVAAANAEALAKWRAAATMDKFAPVRRKFDDAGIAIEIMKFDAVDKMTDEAVDYAIRLAKFMGARAISCEIPVSKTKWLGELAAAHQFPIAYHGHGEVKNPEAFATPESWERAMSYSKFNRINLDIGHFIAGNNTSPIPFIKKYADKITHIHLKDRKLNMGPNTVWGQGDTPIKEVLQLMKKERYPFQGTIEFEYSTPEGSTTLKEIARCVDFCRTALA